MAGNAQDQTHKLTAVIQDSLSGSSIEYASLTIYQAGTKTIVDGAVSDAHGKVTLKVPKAGKYDLLIESIGYHSFHTTREIPSGSGAVNLGRIPLSKSVSGLETVTVLAPTIPIDNRIDKTVFNVEKDLTSQGGVATDILKKIPQVSV
ncbi:MAG TPA: TonB-dependent receptor, partial [Puia sp.]